MQPVSSGYVDVNGINIYHEIYGEGEPLVLLHGGLMRTTEMSPLIQALSEKRRVIAVEVEGHGRTVDTDRPLRFETLGDDVGALIEKLGLGKADVVGWSFWRGHGSTHGDSASRRRAPIGCYRESLRTLRLVYGNTRRDGAGQFKDGRAVDADSSGDCVS